MVGSLSANDSCALSANEQIVPERDVGTERRKFVAEVFVGRMARPPIRTEQKLDIES